MPASLSHRLSWLLRHGAIESALTMDPAGWAAVDDVLRVLAIERDALERTVAENTKSRLELRGDRIRACQGHSPRGTPVTLDALEASWDVYTDDAVVFHGTHGDAVAGIAREGAIHPGERTHVHLADARDSRVGKRSQVEFLLAASPARLRAAGIALYKSPNGVILARRVPCACIVDIEALTHRARGRLGALRAALGLPPAG